MWLPYYGRDVALKSLWDLGIDEATWVVTQFRCPYGIEARHFTKFRDGNKEYLVPMLSQSVLTTSPGSLLTYTSLATWNNNYNTVEVVGGGGGGAHGTSTTTGGGGGGGGAYNRITNFSFASPGTTTAQYEIGVAGVAATPLNGGDTWFNAASFPASGSAVGARGGAGPATTTTATGGAGGLASNGFPTTSPPGVNGGTAGNGASATAGGGGGGAGGPNGAGGAGSGTAGGTADGGKVAGGAAGNPGTAFKGTEFYIANGCGGGGGGSNASGGTGATAVGSGGGAGGGSRSTGAGGNGFQGIIVLTWQYWGFPSEGAIVPLLPFPKASGGSPT